MRCSNIVRIACWLAMGAMIPGGGADATPRPTNDSAARASGKANTEPVGAVTVDSAQINAVVAGTPPSATISIVPVPAKVGSYPPGTAIMGNVLRASAGGFRAWFEVRLFGWDPNHDNIPLLGGFQVSIDATGYMDSDAPGDQPDLAPPVIPCASNADCVAAFGESSARCALGTCKAAYGSGTTCDTSTLDFRCVATNLGGLLDDGTQHYGGTVVLDIPPGAEGKYTVNLSTDETFLWDSACLPNDIPTLFETGFVVNITPPPPVIVWNPSETSPLRGSRSLTIGVAPPPAATATGSAERRAIKVTLVDLQNVFPPNLPQYPPPDFHTYCTGPRTPPVSPACACTASGECLEPQPPTGFCGGVGNCARWVGKPSTFLEAQDIVLGPTYKAARLQCEPFYWDWVAETKDGSTIAIFGAEILPSSTYLVQTYDLSCMGTEATCEEVNIDTPGVCSIMKCSGGPNAGASCVLHSDCGECLAPAPDPGSPCDANNDCTPGTCDIGICDFVKKCSGLPLTPCTVQEDCDLGETCDYFVSCKADPECMALSAGTCIEMVMSTRRLGDVDVQFCPPTCGADTGGQPNAIDVTVMVNKFKSLPGSPSKGQLQLQPNVAELNGDINALDVLAVVDAFKQRAYSFGGPCPCPSKATCGDFECASATVCTVANICVGGANHGKLCPASAPGGVDCPGMCTPTGPLGLGPEAQCVKTCRAPATNVGDPCVKHIHCPGGYCGEVLKCSGGVNAGMPCENDTEAEDCPSSTCGRGYCRDRCGRCTLP